MEAAPDRRTIIELVKRQTGQQAILTIPRYFIELTGDHLSALFLSQCIFNSGKTDDGWFPKSYAEWADELMMTQFQVSRAVKAIQTAELGLHVEKRKRTGIKGPAVLHYRIDQDELTRAIMKYLGEPLSTNLTKVYEETSQRSGKNGDHKSKEESKDKELSLSATADGAPEATDSKPETATESKPSKPRTRNLLMDAVCKVWTIQPGGHAGNIIALLKGTASKGKWKEHRLTDGIDITPQEVLGFGLWWKESYRDASLPQKPDSIASNFELFRAKVSHKAYVVRGEDALRRMYPPTTDAAPRGDVQAPPDQITPEQLRAIKAQRKEQDDAA